MHRSHRTFPFELAFPETKIITSCSSVGTPFVEGATVEASAVKNGKEKKIIVYKYKAKKGYHKKQGHRQPYTKLEIKKING